MGAVLYQIGPEGDRRIVSWSSAKFSRAERNYHVNEQEVLAVVWACKKYRAYLEERPFTLVTDSRALYWLRTYRDERAKLTRWALLLQKYSFTVVHRPGRANQLPDDLSRNPIEEEDLTEAIAEERMLPPDTGRTLVGSAPQLSTLQLPKERLDALKKRRRRRVHSLPKCFTRPSANVRINLIDDAGPDPAEPEPLYEQVRRVQRESVEYQATRARWYRLHNGQEEARASWQRTLRDDYTVEGDLIWYTREQAHALVVPLELWPRVIYEYHDSPRAGHPGRDETIRAAGQLYYWPAMKKQIKTHVKHCLICASMKRGGANQPHAPLRPHPPSQPWRVISMDIMGPYPVTKRKNRYLLVATDIFSKWVELCPVPDTTGRKVVDFLRGVCNRWGFPEQIITDNGPQFSSNAWERFLREHHIAAYFAPVYHQRANPVERRNQEIKKLLRVRLQGRNENRWDEELEAIAFILHTRQNAATGQSPSQLLLGAPLVKPGEWNHPNVQRPIHNDAQARRQRIRRARARQVVFQRHLFPEPRNAPIHFRPGERVLVRAFPGVRTPFGAAWEGPYPIITVKGDNVYEIDRNGAQDLVHVDDIRPAPGPAPDPREDRDILARPPGEDEEGGDGDDDDPPPLEIPAGERPASPEPLPEGEEDPEPRFQPAGPQPGPSHGLSWVSRVHDSPTPDRWPSKGAAQGMTVTTREIELDQHHTVIMEDIGSEEPEARGWNGTAVPIAGLWP